ncbi:MAG: hypothetical protein ABIT05_04815 [Chitinophagaceae bacterium]
MKRIFFLILASCCLNFALAQSTTKKKPAGKQQVVSAGINISLGDFASTHIGGIAVEYSRSQHRYGQLTAMPAKKLGYLIEGGLAYYFGKKETVSGYSYDYPGYYFLHVYPGLVFNLCIKGHINISAGPGLGLYNGDPRFTIGAKFQGTWYMNEKTGITPGILVMKESGADPLWAVSLKATLAF